MIGSRVRPDEDPIAAADGFADWDYQLIVGNPSDFLSPLWLHRVELGRIVAVAVRRPLWEGGLKINVVLEDEEIDLMVFPAGAMARLKWMTRLGLHRRSRWAMRSLQTLIHFVRPGWRFLKGAEWLGPLYDFAGRNIPDPRLSDEDVRRIAVAFSCDQIWALRKIRRGELLAAQRILHLELAEANFRLLHELKLRRGERSFERARRIEKIASESELSAVTVCAACEATALEAAVERSASACDRLVRELVGAGWQRPIRANTALQPGSFVKQRSNRP